MIQKGNYFTPEVEIVSFQVDDMIRTSIELTDGVAMKFDKSWIDGAQEE